MLLRRAMSFTTIFATKKEPSVFKQANDFELGYISAAVDNCVTSNMISDRSLFFGKLVSTKYAA